MRATQKSVATARDLEITCSYDLPFILHSKPFNISAKLTMMLLIHLDSGDVMSGLIGSKLPKFSLFGMSISC